MSLDTEIIAEPLVGRPKIQYKWEKDEQGNILMPTIDIPVDADEVSVKITTSHSSVNGER
jgi:hypothetical protein